MQNVETVRKWMYTERLARLQSHTDDLQRVISSQRDEREGRVTAALLYYI